jgi:hypothetical protein
MPKITFTETPEGYAYTAPYTYEVSDELAKKFVSEGVAELATPVLPEGFPARNQLIELGYDTIESIRENIDALEDELGKRNFNAVKKAIN